MSEIKIGVDWAKGNDKTCVVFMRKEDDGAVVIGELFGEAAEYVAQLEEQSARLLAVARAAAEYHEITVAHWSSFAHTMDEYEGRRMMRSSRLISALAAVEDLL